MTGGITPIGAPFKAYTNCSANVERRALAVNELLSGWKRKSLCRV